MLLVKNVSKARGHICIITYLFTVLKMHIIQKMTKKK